MELSFVASKQRADCRRSAAYAAKMERMIATQRADLVCRLARAAGFEGVGIAPAGLVPRAEYLQAWLERGWAGEMAYLARWRELRADPRLLLDGARSVIVVAHVYGHGGGGGAQGAGFGVQGAGFREDGTEGESGRGGEGEKNSLEASAKSCEGAPSKIPNPKSAVGRIAQYAWGRDYHDVMRKKLHGLVDALRQELDEPFAARVCVDTAPILEREWAAAAGVGWIGKNTLAINARLGSFFFLGEIVTTLELSPSAPAVDHCGSCTRCLEACPTGALVAPYEMDARRCISYLTIEHRSEVPTELRGLMGDWLYGCDICQDVCPHNRKAPATTEAEYAPGANPLTPRANLDAVVAMTQDEYQRAVNGSAMQRASLEMLQRNAAIVSANAAVY